MSMRTAPKATREVAKIVVNERMELVLMSIVKERQGVESES